MRIGPIEEREAGQAGFTLVEVLVAFMIMALTLTMALRLLADGAVWARRGPLEADRVEEAASIVTLRIADPRPGEADGVFADGAPWHLRATDVTAQVAQSPKARLVRIELFVAGGARPLFVTLAGGPVP